MLRHIVLAFLGLIPVPALAAPRPQLQRDVEGYAIAACLMQQKSTELQQQGDAWGSIILNRSPATLAAWRPLAAAVKAETQRRPMTLVHGDTALGQTEAPVFYCAEIIDTPLVRKAIDRASAKLAVSYRRK